MMQYKLNWLIQFFIFIFILLHQPQAFDFYFLLHINMYDIVSWDVILNLSFEWFQTISYMAERVVGSGSFGVVFQVRFYMICSMKQFFLSSFWNALILCSSFILLLLIHFPTFLGKMLRDRRNCGYKESPSRQAIQEPWAANHAPSWPPKCGRFEALFLFNDWKVWTISKFGSWVRSWDGSSCDQTLQQVEPENAYYICQTLHIPGMHLISILSFSKIVVFLLLKHFDSKLLHVICRYLGHYLTFIGALECVTETSNLKIFWYAMLIAILHSPPYVFLVVM